MAPSYHHGMTTLIMWNGSKLPSWADDTNNGMAPSYHHGLTTLIMWNGSKLPSWADDTNNVEWLQVTIMG